MVCNVFPKLAFEILGSCDTFGKLKEKKIFFILKNNLKKYTNKKKNKRVLFKKKKEMRCNKIYLIFFRKRIISK